jgi:hypothetical protein
MAKNSQDNLLKCHYIAKQTLSVLWISSNLCICPKETILTAQLLEQAFK